MINETLHACLSCSVFRTQPVFDLVEQKLAVAGRSFAMTAGGNLVSWGPRPDAVVLVAHADTVWNICNDRPVRWRKNVDVDAPTPLSIVDGIVTRGPESLTGIGADDRAGVAIMLETIDLGHTLLITNDEEIGMIGARKLRGQGGAVFDRLQQHRFFLQFDRKGSRDFKCYDVGTDEFREYVHKETGLTEPDRSSFTDVVTLCRDIPGVNISVGYEMEHTRNEMLDLSAWNQALSTVRSWLARPIPEFKLPRPHRGCSAFPPIQTLDEVSRGF